MPDINAKELRVEGGDSQLVGDTITIEVVAANQEFFPPTLPSNPSACGSETGGTPSGHRAEVIVEVLRDGSQVVETVRRELCVNAAGGEEVATIRTSVDTSGRYVVRADVQGLPTGKTDRITREFRAEERVSGPPADDGGSDDNGNDDDDDGDGGLLSDLFGDGLDQKMKIGLVVLGLLALSNIAGSAEEVVG